MAKITVQTARELSARGNQIKREIARARNERLANIDKVLAHAVSVCEENSVLKAAIKAAIPEQGEEYRTKRLSRVRKQLDLVDGMIEVEIDPAKLDRLASAQSRLSEQERQLSNRSLPPTLKANQVKPRRAGSSSVDPEPV